MGIFLTGIIYLYIKRLQTQDKEKIATLKAQNYVLSLEQKALQLQMNPHFIFNVLNGIKALGSSGKSVELNKTINQFAILLRSVLNNSRQEEISLQEEIETLRNYIELEQQMATNPFEYSIHQELNVIDPEEILIPPMLLQPFVENSIKHGIRSNSKKGKLRISFLIKNDFLYCSIEDNGIGIHQSKKIKTSKNHWSMAIDVTKERIRSLSVKDSFFIDEIIQNNQVEGTRVWFGIPLKTDF